LRRLDIIQGDDQLIHPSVDDRDLLSFSFFLPVVALYLTLRLSLYRLHIQTNDNDPGRPVKVVRLKSDRWLVASYSNNRRSEARSMSKLEGIDGVKQ
jgi:hypothetical protein